MKVVYRGTSPESLPFNLECSNCGTIVEVLKTELAHSPDQRDPGSYIHCPVCKKEIWDKPNVRANASVKLAKKAEEKRREIEKNSGDSRDYSYMRDYDPGPRSGGATGPLPPPELPHYVKSARAIAGVK